MRILFAKKEYVKVKIKRNVRKIISANVDKSRIKDNITIINQSVSEAYEHVFGEAQRKYNANQKRKERIITDYYTHLFGNIPESEKDEIQTSTNNQHSFLEYFVQVGNKEDTGFVTNPENAQTAIACLLEYAENFQKRNPNLYLFNAIIHCDEAVPNLYLDFIPFAEGYKKGMERQLSIVKAFEAMDYEKDSENTSWDFIVNERKILREICEQHGLEIDKEDRSRTVKFTPQKMTEAIAETRSKLHETEMLLQEKQAELARVTEQLRIKEAELELKKAKLEFLKSKLIFLKAFKNYLKHYIAYYNISTENQIDIDKQDENKF